PSTKFGLEVSHVRDGRIFPAPRTSIMRPPIRRMTAMKLKPALLSLVFAALPGLTSVTATADTSAAPQAAPPAAPPSAQPNAAALAGRVQAFYNRTQTFQADFTQRYTIKAYSRTKDSSGKVAFEKPGKMSWRYTTNGNRVVSDGKIL